MSAEPVPASTAKPGILVDTAAVLDALDASVAIIDSGGCILAVNQAWKAFGRGNGYAHPLCGVGENYLAVCSSAGGSDRDTATLVLSGLAAVLHGGVPAFVLEYSCNSPQVERWFQMRASPVRFEGFSGAAVMHVDISQRKRGENALRASERSLMQSEALLKMSSRLGKVGAWSVDMAHSRITWSDEARAIYGKPAGYVPALDRALDSFAPKYRKALSSSYRDCALQGAPFDLEAEIILPDGATKWVRMVGECVRDGGAAIVHIHGALQDIDLYKHAQINLSRSNHELLLLHRCNEAMTARAANEEDLLAAVCNAMVDTGGYRAARVCAALDDEAKSVTPVYSVGLEPRAVDMPGGSWSLEGPMGTGIVGQAIRDRKAVLVADVAAQPLQDPWAHALVAMGVNSVVALPLMDERQVFGVIVIYLRMGQLPACKELEFLQEIAGNLASRLLGRRARMERERSLAKVEEQAAELLRSRDEILSLNASLEERVARRTTELSHATEVAMSANRAKSSFLAAMSHEIRTPMNGVLGLLELLSLTPLDSDQQSTLSVVRESGRALLRIIDDILDFSKIEADRMELNPVPASVAEVVERVCQIHSGAASSRGLLLHGKADPAISDCLLFDPLRLGQILNNFIGNAIKFTEHGSVQLTVRSEGRANGVERLRFIVEDTGIGISAENIGKLFQPFVQADLETASRFGGTGLGLVISRRLAGLMGGTVEMRSTLGQGTAMELSVGFPLADAGQLPVDGSHGSREQLDALVSSRRGAPSEQEAQAEGTLLLLVDDHPTNRMVLKRQIQSLGYAGETAADGVQALALWESGRFGAIITDCNMPEMSGYELARAVRAAEARAGGGRIPIIACTANAMNTEARNCMEAGMDDYMLKPVAMAELGRRLDRWLPLDRAGRARSAPRQELLLPDAAQPAQAALSRVLDPAPLAEISGGSREVEDAILEDFRRTNDKDAALLRAMSRAGNFPQLARYAHRIKGASQMIGAMALGDVCLQLERAGNACDPAAVAAAMPAFEHALEHLARHIASRGAAPAPPRPAAPGA